MSKEVVRTEAAPAPFQGAPYSQAIKAGGLVFVSGQLALEPGHTDLLGDTIAEQTEQVLANLRTILEQAGSGLDRLAQGAGLTVHVRLIEGSETQHVLEAIFKALGAALAQACAPRREHG